jgi:hypothetical protein
MEGKKKQTEQLLNNEDHKANTGNEHNVKQEKTNEVNEQQEEIAVAALKNKKGSVGIA